MFRIIIYTKLPLSSITRYSWVTVLFLLRQRVIGYILKFAKTRLKMNWDLILNSQKFS